jgi:hypothetical protein
MPLPPLRLRLLLLHMLPPCQAWRAVAWATAPPRCWCL